MKRYDFFADGVSRDNAALKLVAERFWKMRRLKSTTIRSRFMEAVLNIRYYHSIHKDMGGMGGCLNIPEWRASDMDTDTPVLAVVKELICIFCEDNGFYERDFLQWVMELILHIQTNYELGKYFD